MKINGIAIPLQNITPDLTFYPLALPSNIIYIKYNNIYNNNNNNNNNNAIIYLNTGNQLTFVNTLMKLLNIKYMIIGSFLFDLSRNDFQFTIKNGDDSKNIDIYISEYKDNIAKTFITDKYLKSKKNELNLENFNNDNQNINDINDYINYHCNRILLNT